MSDPSSEPRIVDIGEWIDRAKRDPRDYVVRQATDVVLATIGALPGYEGHFFLKGGILMAVVYNSPRTTTDVDFTTDLLASSDLVATLKEELNNSFPRVTARLGYPDLRLRVQSIQERPQAFSGDRVQSFPALKIKIAFTKRGQPDERHFEKGQSPHVVRIDVSFNEPIHSTELIRLSVRGEGRSSTIAVYGITDLISEKLRALLQQTVRNNGQRAEGRRQDVYDIALLIDQFPLSDTERASVLAAFHEKCASRDINPTPASLEDNRVIELARAEWHTLSQEIGDLPDFEVCFAKVRDFYKSLPWDEGWPSPNGP